jgi:hypothetical protein
MAEPKDETYFNNTDQISGNVIDARGACATLSDWMQANVADTPYRRKALRSLRRVERELVDAVVYDIDNP